MSRKRGIMRFVWISNKPEIATELYSSIYRWLGTGEHKNMSTTTPWFIRARLKTRQLMLLTAICDEGNIHRAAEVLNMSQPAASKLLKDLEDMLGVSLFERQPRGMRPNWYGETMIRHARIALSSLREAGQEIDALKAGLSGHVSLGAITGPALSLIPQAIMIVARENPKLRVELHVESSNVLIEQLAQGKIDIMIGRLFERQDKTGSALRAPRGRAGVPRSCGPAIRCSTWPASISRRSRRSRGSCRPRAACCGIASI